MRCTPATTLYCFLLLAAHSATPIWGHHAAATSAARQAGSVPTSVAGVAWHSHAQRLLEHRGPKLHASAWGRPQLRSPAATCGSCTLHSSLLGCWLLASWQGCSDCEWCRLAVPRLWVVQGLVSSLRCTRVSCSTHLFRLHAVGSVRLSVAY